MADQQEEEDMRMALRMSIQNSPPEPKRSKPREASNLATTTTTPEESRLLQRELMAVAAEKRMLAAVKSVPASSSPLKSERGGDLGRKEMEIKAKEVNLRNELSEEEAYQLFLMVFGSDVSKDILAQWSNQGIRFSRWFFLFLVVSPTHPPCFSMLLSEDLPDTSSLFLLIKDNVVVDDELLQSSSSTISFLSFIGMDSNLEESDAYLITCHPNLDASILSNAVNIITCSAFCNPKE